MGNFKVFHPRDCDNSLTRVITHGGASYLMFPFINATGTSPKFNSVDCLIQGPGGTALDFERLYGLIEELRAEGEWFISFNTPWLVTGTQADSIRQDMRSPKPRRQ